MKKVKAWYHPRGREASQFYFMARHAGHEPLWFVGGTGAGKTTFLKNDLMPLANGAKDGSLAVYIALGTDRDNPLDVILNAINREIDDLKKQPWGRVVSAATTPVESIEFAGAGIKFGSTGSAPVPVHSGLIQLDRAIGELKRLAKKPVLLVIDDAHLLLRAKDVGALCSCLRATVSSDPGNINAIFAMDSFTSAESLFTRKGAPFFKFGRQGKFPPAGEAFVETMVSLYEIETGQALDERVMKEAFHSLFKQPRAFMTLIGMMAADGNKQPTEYIADLRAEVMQEDDWTDVECTLSSMQQSIIRRVAMNKSPDSDDALQIYAREAGKTRLSPDTLQREMKPLVEQRLIVQVEGRWQVANEEYLNWLTQRMTPTLPPAPHESMGSAPAIRAVAPRLG